MAPSRGCLESQCHKLSYSYTQRIKYAKNAHVNANKNRRIYE